MRRDLTTRQTSARCDGAVSSKARRGNRLKTRSSLIVNEATVCRCSFSITFEKIACRTLLLRAVFPLIAGLAQAGSMGKLKRKANPRLHFTNGRMRPGSCLRHCHCLGVNERIAPRLMMLASRRGAVEWTCATRVCFRGSMLICSDGDPLLESRQRKRDNSLDIQ